MIYYFNMNCPMFVDFVRECSNKIGFIPNDTYTHCTNDSYKDCLFYKAINNISYHCENIFKCPAFKYFGMNNFKKFEEITQKYCLSENNQNCARYKIKKSGQIPPPNLLPDGNSIEEQK